MSNEDKLVLDKKIELIKLAQYVIVCLNTTSKFLLNSTAVVQSIWDR